MGRRFAWSESERGRHHAERRPLLVRNCENALLVFYAFNYGSLGALSFASGLPWLCLLRASKLRGFRPKSHALLRAVMNYRGIE